MLLEEDVKSPSLIYTKIRKPQQFREKDLLDYELYSIISCTRIKDIDDRTLNSFQRLYRIKTAIKNGLRKLAGD